MHHDYPDAHHYTWAYRINEATVRASDDGEPHGTAGLPILNILVRENWTETLVVVARYFGGIKLGRGGLVRAYQQTGQLALQCTIPGICTPIERLVLRVSYSAFERLSRPVTAMALKTEPEFGEYVVWRLVIAESRHADLEQCLEREGPHRWEMLSREADHEIFPIMPG